LSHGRHQHNNQNGDDMEAQIHQDRALFDPSEVKAQVFDLSLLFLAESVTPNLVVLDINILNKCAIQISTVFIVFSRPLILFIGSVLQFIETA
jgi:hypothetical protein